MIKIKLYELKELLSAEVIWGKHELEREVTSGLGCDLLSDSLSMAEPNCVLLTGLTNIQVIRIAEIVDAAAVIFVRGKQPAPEVIAEAQKRNLPVLVTNFYLYESCGILYQAGLKSAYKRSLAS